MTKQEVEEKFRQSLKQEHKIIDSGFKVDELVIKLELNSQEYAKHFTDSCVLFVFKDNDEDFKFLHFNGDLFNSIISSITGTKFVIHTGVYGEQYLASKQINNKEDLYNLDIAEVDEEWITFIQKCNKIAYDDYLKTKHWKYFREKSIEDKNYKCEQCESSYELDVHHKNYDCLGKETFSDVKVLCIDCHSKELGGRDLKITRQ